MRALALLIALTLAAKADAPNLSSSPSVKPGAASQLVLAQRSYEAALRSGDPILLITAIRLAREVTLRPATGWAKTTDGDPSPDQPEGKSAPPDPAGPEAITIAQGLAREDPDIQDLVYDLDAQLPHGRRPTATEVVSKLDGGQADSWKMVLAGESSGEFGLIGDGDSPLSLTLVDDTGAAVCILPASLEPRLCRFTPARNGFFTAKVRNEGAVRNSYRLVGN